MLFLSWLPHETFPYHMIHHFLLIHLHFFLLANIKLIFQVKEGISHEQYGKVLSMIWAADYVRLV